MEAKSICKVDFGYIFTFFGAEVGLVANKFWGEMGVLALHPGWATFDTELWQNEGRYYFTEAGEGMPNSALKRSAKLVSFCPNSLVPTGTWTTKKMNTTQPYCLGQVAFALCSDQGDLATFSIYSCVSRFQPSEVFGKMVTGKKMATIFYLTNLVFWKHLKCFW